MTKQRIPPISKQSFPFRPTLPFLEKIFHYHPYCRIRRSQSPLCKGGMAFNYDFGQLMHMKLLVRLLKDLKYTSFIFVVQL